MEKDGLCHMRYLALLPLEVEGLRGNGQSMTQRDQDPRLTVLS